MDDQQISQTIGETSEETNTIAITPVETENQATLLLNLEDMIKRHISSVEKLQVEMKKHKEMFDDAFENSPVYKEHADTLREAQKQKSTTRQEILKQPQMIQ